MLRPPPPGRADGMAFWPFGRNKRRKNTEKADAENTTTTIEKQKSLETAPSKEAQRPSVSSVPSKLTKRLSKSSRKGRERSSSRASRTNPARDLEQELPPVPSIPLQHARPDKGIETPPSEGEAMARPPLAELHNASIPRPRPAARPTESQTSLQPEKFTVHGVDALPPTLRPKRSTTADAEMPRRKSNKRRSGNPEREKALKALSGAGPSSPIPIPKRPQSYTSGIMSRDSRKFHGGLNRHLERPASEISLPKPDSVRSSGSHASDWPQNSFQVSAFDALAPRPTIRHLDSPRGDGSRASTRKDKGPAIPEEDFNSTKRMKDLADDLDSKGLRELMDRDTRRRKRRERRDGEKLKKKLELRGEKERIRHVPTEDDAAMRDAGRTAPEPSRAATPPRSPDDEGARDDMQSPSSWLQGPSKSTSREALPTPTQDPFQDPAAEARRDAGTPSDRGSERESPVIETAKAVRLSSASLSPPISPETSRHARGPSHLSQLIAASTDDRPPDGSDGLQVHGAEGLQLDESAAARVAPPPSQQHHTPVPPAETPAELESEAEAAPAPTIPLSPARQKESDSGARPPSGSGGGWAAFFRRGLSRRKPRERAPPPPSEFSNTSRESFARSARSRAATHSPPPGVGIGGLPPSFKRPSAASASSAPQRTQSRFREDLPELPAASASASASASPPPPPPGHPTSHDGTLSRGQSHELSPVPSHDDGGAAAASPLPSPRSPFLDDAAKIEGLDAEARGATPLDHVHPAFRDALTPSRGPSLRSTAASPHPHSPGFGEGPSSRLLSQSLASVDSEGSWLSGGGGRAKRGSGVPIGSVRESQASLVTPRNEAESPLREADEPPADADDDAPVFARRDPQRAAPAGPGGLSAQLHDARAAAAPARPSAATTASAATTDTRVASSTAPTTSSTATAAAPAAEPAGSAEQAPRSPGLRYERVGAYHASPRIAASPLPARASEGVRGVIGTVGDDHPTTAASASAAAEPVSPASPASPDAPGGDDADLPSPASPDAPDSPARGASGDSGIVERSGAGGATVQRATSVDYGRSGHARQVSAGSARLLDLGPKRAGAGREEEGRETAG